MTDEAKHKKPVACEILQNGCLCFIMPTEAEPDAEPLIFVTKVRITNNFEIRDGRGFVIPAFTKPTE